MIYFSCCYCLYNLTRFLTLVISWLSRPQAGLHFFVYPLFSFMDLFGIYQGLKHVHLKTLTKVSFLMALVMKLCTDLRFLSFILKRLKLSDYGRNEMWYPFIVYFVIKHLLFYFSFI